MSDRLKCSNCGAAIDGYFKLDGKPVCAECAHKASASYPTSNIHGPCPVTDGDGNVIPRGRYPNIDWS